MAGIDAVLYINLIHRTEKAEVCGPHLEALFGDKVQRFDATLCKELPRRGSGTSHIRALEMAEANRWGATLICEDDVEFYASAEEVEAHLTECMRSCAAEAAAAGSTEDDGWDVIMLGGYFPHNRSTSSPHTKRTCLATGSHCYLVHGSYCRVLRDQIELSLNSDLQNDLGWWPLQQRDRWVACDPVLAGQRDGHSDMTNKETQLMQKEAWDTKFCSGSLRCFNSCDDEDI